MSDAAFAIDPAEVREWRRYPAYRDSGVEWIGEVPPGWEVTQDAHDFSQGSSH